MKAAVISFTGKGGRWNRVITDRLRSEDICCTGYGFYKYGEEGLEPFSHVRELMESLFSSCDLLLFIGAAGIAVRAVAPFIRGKAQDPAVLVMDECAHHVISLLSGHLGGANEWCRRIALLTRAEPVITTATDLHGIFAVDLFARENCLAVRNTEAIREVSGRLLHGEKAGFYSEIPWEGELPSSLILFSEKEKEDVRKPEYGIVISADADKQIFPITCFLAPRDLTVGIGSRKGIAREEITRCLTRVLEENGLWEGRIARLASASLKREEPGIQEEALARRVPFLTYTPEELERVPGTFHGSSFVEKTVGVDNVCERAAVLGSGGGELLVGKRAGSGVTVAIARQEVPTLHFADTEKENGQL